MSTYITDIDCGFKTVPLKRPFITALHKVTKIQGLKVTIKLSDGQIGIGTATPNEKVTGDNQMAL